MAASVQRETGVKSPEYSRAESCSTFFRAEQRRRGDNGKGFMHRRHFLAASAALGARLVLPARAAASALTRCDMHTHVAGGKLDLHEAMVRNGMLLLARTLSADRPVIRNEPGKGFRQIREPQPGELASSFDERLAG